MFILPFVILLLRMTLWGATSEHRLKQFFQGSSNRTLICIGGVCPSVEGIKPIVLSGTLTEQHAKFLAILLQLKSTSLVAIACPKPFHADVKAALQSFTFKNVLVV